MPENATSTSGSTANNTTSPSAVDVQKQRERCTSVETCGIPPEEPPAQAPNPGPQHSGSMENITSGMESNNIANARQESNSTGNATSTGGPTQVNNATSPSGSTASNNTLPYYNVNTTNAYCDSCNNDIYFHNPPMDLANMVLAVHNRERAAVGVPPLVWNETAAAHAKVWAEWNAKNGTLLHCVFVPESVHKDWQYIESCTHHEGENLAAGGRGPPVTTVPIAQSMQGWIAEKNYYQGRPSATGTKVTGHYLQMISRDAKSVGCGTASGGPNDWRGWGIISCRYYPPGINVTGVGSGPTQ
ncbi:MAG: CAP domain-containing protein [Candidatus Nitrosopolaris sp.]